MSETMATPIAARIARYGITHFAELCRFGIVGVVTFVINFLTFSLVFGRLHWDYRVAVSLAYVITVCCHFLLNKSFTFNATSYRLRRSAPRYGLMLGLNYLITVIAAWITVDVAGLSPYLGVVAATMGTATSSFIVMKYFVFSASP